MPIGVYSPDSPPSWGDTRVGAVWTGANGDSITLTSAPDGITWLKGREGIDMPPYQLFEDDVPDGDGATVRGVRALPRNVVLPLLVYLQDVPTWRTRIQQLARALDPIAGPGVLALTQPDGETRRLNAYYAGGAEGDTISDPDGLQYRIWAVKLRAVDPWWYDDEAVTLTFANTPGAGFFPILPVLLGSSSVLGFTTANLSGDVRTYGVWTISGPADGLVTLRSETLDRQVVLDLSGADALATGDTVIVDMREGQQSIRAGDGTNLWRTRVGVPQMWPLLPGDNDIELSVSGATEDTFVTFEYTPRWIMA